MNSTIAEYLGPPPAAQSFEPGSLDPGFFVPAGHEAGASQYSLVKGPQSPTWENSPEVGAKPREICELETPSGTAGAYAVVQFREWSEQWRIRTRVDPLSYTVPPGGAGPRVTDVLTLQAAKKIMESCEYVATCRGGYKTFLTLTLDQPARCRLSARVAGPFSLLKSRARFEAGPDVIGEGSVYSCLQTRDVIEGRSGPEIHRDNARLIEVTIQKEVSRFFDGLQKIYARGWEGEDINGQAFKAPGYDLGLDYVWVAEIPDTINEQTGEVGAPNPHIHVLLNWKVHYKWFTAWAERIERLWGQGFAHLEKIKDGTAAAAYMMKAAGYLCKAQGKSDQGTIRGNRYSMSATARAPAWVTVEERALHSMGALIADVNQHVTEQHGEDFELRKRLNAALDKAEKGSKVRKAIGKRLEACRARLRELPVVASKYQIILKGHDTAAVFMAWAKCGDGHAPGVPWLPQKPAGVAWSPEDARPDSRWYRRYMGFVPAITERHLWARACRAAACKNLFGWIDADFNNAAGEYETWAAIAGQ